MERKPEDLNQDPMLRTEFVNQVSCDEYFAIYSPFLLHPQARQLVEMGLRAQGMDAEYQDVLDVATDQWRATLNPETRLTEELYLLGYTSYPQRQQMIEQMHAQLVRRAVEAGLIDERPKDIEFRKLFGK
jgi:hypothetical protein